MKPRSMGGTGNRTAPSPTRQGNPASAPHHSKGTTLHATISTLTLGEVKRLSHALTEQVARIAPWPQRPTDATGPTVIAWNAGQAAARLWLTSVTVHTAEQDTAWQSRLVDEARAFYATAGLIAYTAAHVSNEAAHQLARRYYVIARDDDQTGRLLDELTDIAGSAHAAAAADLLDRDMRTGAWEEAVHRLAVIHNASYERVLDSAKRSAGIGW